jgi:hypothetical protein
VAGQLLRLPDGPHSLDNGLVEAENAVLSSHFAAVFCHIDRLAISG